MCPKSKTWMCDGDCLACEFRAAGDNLSLDYTIEDGEGNQKSWADDLQDDTPDAQSIMEDRELLCTLYQKLQELDPEGRRIDRLKTIPELVARAPFLSEDWPKSDKVSVCEQCYIYTRGKCSGEADYCIYNKQNRALWYQEPPEGEGYQLWENTTEGSPLSPVFPSLDVLCAWAADNATLFGDFKVSKDVWNRILSKGAKQKDA